MNGLVMLIPLALMLGLGALAAFLWALRSGQYDDLKGAGERILAPDPQELGGKTVVPPSDLTSLGDAQHPTSP